jgi:hypothetical protein
MPHALKSLFATAAVACSFLALGAAPAVAATPCWKLVINDWYDGRIDNTYPVACYEEAIRHLPEDVRDYTGASDEISRAMFAAIHQDRGDGPGPDGGTGGSAAPYTATGSDGAPKGFIERLLDDLGPSNASAVPLPLLVLAGIALLLLTAAGGSFLAKWIQARRMTPATATAPTRPNPPK